MMGEEMIRVMMVMNEFGHVNIKFYYEVEESI